ncbi:MAG: TetR/AcrR family transcriptional regulator [bacterium]
MSEDKEVKQKIIDRANELFKQFGFHKVTMEEIASDIGISKKTLYKHFANKEQVIKEIVFSNKCVVDEFIENLVNDSSLQVIEKLKRLLNFIAQQANKLEGQMIKDLMKIHPQIWKDIDEFRTKRAYKHLAILINDGIKEKIFRNDVHPEVFIILYVSAIHSIINPDTLSKLPISSTEAFGDIMKILFDGIFTTEGRRKYKTLIKENLGEINL